MTVFTIGHSTRPLEEFLALLEAYGIRQLVDIRTVPKSRRHPQFAGEALSQSLAGAGVAYRHMAALGGLRKPRPDSRNTAWRHAGFRGYADYMETPAFRTAVDELIAFARAAPTAIMCAEAVWWRCHRKMVADALVARGVTVRHVMTAAAAPEHALPDFAEAAGGDVRYGPPS